MEVRVKSRRKQIMFDLRHLLESAFLLQGVALVDTMVKSKRSAIEFIWSSFGVN